MGNIANYSTSSPVIATDKWIGTSGADSSTKNFTAEDVRDFVSPHEVNDTILTNYTFAIRDQYNTMVYTGTGNAPWNLPANATVAFEIGTTILVCNGSADTITITPAGAVTLNGTATIATGESKTLKKTDTNTWFIF